MLSASRPNSRILAPAVLAAVFFAAFLFVRVETQAQVNATILLKKDKSTGLFNLTITDPDGIQSFSLVPAGGSPYGGDLRCPRSYNNPNLRLNDPADFTPKMEGTVTDCKGNIAQFTIAPPKDGLTRGVAVTAPEEKPKAEEKAAPAAEEPKAEPAETKEPAKTLAQIEYPVPELGNCKSEKECLTFCDNPDNAKVCIAFAKEHELLPAEEIAAAEKMLSIGKGPGGCTTRNSCETYCNDVTHIDECVAFGEKQGFLKGKELEEAKKVQSALARGAALPGGCRSKSECDSFCKNPQNMEVCIAFAEEAGFIPPDELEDAKKALAAVKKGAKPPPCMGRQECDAYCGEPENLEECLAFAEAAGFISPDELAMVRKTGGKGPGGCRGKKECERFCEDEANFPVCMEFAVANGMMSSEEAEMAKKTGGKGPGNCKGKQECEAFCQNPANQEVCFNFAREHGLISEEDLARMEEGKAKLQEFFANAPVEVVECLRTKLGSEYVDQLQAGTAMPRDIKNEIEACFQEMGPGFGPPGGETGPPEGGTWPPGGPPEGGMPPGMPPGEGPPKGGVSCFWCGQSCVKVDFKEPPLCPQVMPPPGLWCTEENGECVEKPISESGGLMPPEGAVPGRMPADIMPEGLSPEEMQQPPSPEMMQQIQQQMEQQIRQQIQQQMQQQIQQQMQQQMMPPLSESPPSGLRAPSLGEFLRSLTATLLFGIQ